MNLCMHALIDGGREGEMHACTVCPSIYVCLSVYACVFVCRSAGRRQAGR